MKNLFWNKRLQAMVLATVLTTGGGLTGCTDEEVAATIGAIAIVGGAVAIGATTECQGGYKDVCHDYRDYWGHLHSECHEEYDSCLYLVPKRDRLDLTLSSVNLLADEIAADAATEALTYEIAEATATPAMWGKTFGISFDASKEFIDAMKAAKAGDPQAIEKLGLKKKDIEKIASQKMPSDQAIDAVALNLKQDKAAVSEMFKQLITLAKTPEVKAAIGKKD